MAPLAGAARRRPRRLGPIFKTRLLVQAFPPYGVFIWGRRDLIPSYRCTRAHVRRRIHIYTAVRDADRTGHCVSRSALPAVLIRVSLLFVFFIVEGARFKLDSISFALR